jgi:hypothetical protein
MVDRSNFSGLGMAVVAVVSTGVILVSYHLIHRRLESNLKLDTTIGKQTSQLLNLLGSILFILLRL